MKRLLIVQSLLLMSLFVSAQAASADKYIKVLEVVIDDVRNDFRHIKSKSISPGVFESNQSMPGAQRSVVNLAGDKTFAEWVASFKPYDDKQKAVVEFDQISKTMSNAIINVAGEQPYILNGTPFTCERSEQLRCSLFQLLPHKGSVAATAVMLSIVKSAGKYRVELVVRNRPAA
jgi:hypothetical protein